MSIVKEAEALVIRTLNHDLDAAVQRINQLNRRIQDLEGQKGNAMRVDKAIESLVATSCQRIDQLIEKVQGLEEQLAKEIAGSKAMEQRLRDFAHLAMAAYADPRSPEAREMCREACRILGLEATSPGV